MAVRRYAKQLQSVLIKPAGPDCNLACRYCFYLDKQRLFADSPTHRMSAEVLAATVQQVMTQGGSTVVFGWQGGEPTLMGLDFFKQAVELQLRHGRPGQTIGNGLQTNGLLIDGAWLPFLRERQVLVGLSLDGPQHVHDRYRVTRNGRGTWSRVVEASQRMLDAGVEVNALVVINDYSAGFAREIYEFLKQRGLTYMQFIPCMDEDPSQSGRPAPYAVRPEQLGRFWCELFDCWYGDFRGGEQTTSVRWFESVFATYAGVRPVECTVRAECGDYVVVEHNGDVFACDFFVEPGWQLGNVLRDDLADLLNSPRQADFGRRKAALPQDCQVCPWLSHCRGGCPKERWGDPVRANRSAYCEAYRAFFAHADERFRELARRWLAAPTTEPEIPPVRVDRLVGRNDPCPCGSGQKYKRCCGR